MDRLPSRRASTDGVVVAQRLVCGQSIAA